MSFTVRQLKDDRPPKKKFPWKRAAAAAAVGIAPLAYAWQKRQEKKEAASQDGTVRTLALKRVLFILVGVLISLFIVAGIAQALVKLQVFTLDDAMDVVGSAPPVDEHGYTNILLLGQGHDQHEGVDLTDSIMVASIDPTNTKSVVLLSIPRDLYLLSTEKMGKGRINSMYRDYKTYLRFNEDMSTEDASQAAMKEVAAEIGRNLDLDIHGVVKIDFIGFEEAVDAIGGITVDVPYDIVDTEYPNESYGYETFQISQGTQTLDGATALKYARSRHSTSDFDRSARQQQVLKAIAGKIKTEDGLQIGELVGVLRSISDHLEYTMPFSEMVGLADVARNIDRNNILTMQLNDRNALYNGLVEPGGFLYTPPRDQFGGAAVLLPMSIPEFPVTWKQIKALVQLLIKDRSLHLANPSIAILNAGARSGSARYLATELIRYGLDVPVIENADSDDVPQSILAYNDEADADLAKHLADILHLTVGPVPAGLPPEQQSRFTILLGEDYSYTPLQDLLPAAE